MPNESAAAKIVIDPAVLARAAARDAEINGRPARVEPLGEDEYTPDVLKLTSDMKAAAGIPPSGYVPEFFGIMLRHPSLFKAHSDLAMALMAGNSLPVRDRELAILRVAWLTGAPYEWNAHVDMAKRLTNITPEEIERTIIGSAAPGWSEHETALLRAVEEMLSNAMITDETWTTLIKTYDEAQLLEFPILVGQYLGVAYLQNSIRARLMPGHVGLSAR
jgi:4-carboxymuconolactone decarboxylase